MRQKVGAFVNPIDTRVRVVPPHNHEGNVMTLSRGIMRAFSIYEARSARRRGKRLT